jgi:hypothetical protein
MACPEGGYATQLWPTVSTRSSRPDSHFSREAKNQDSFHAGNKHEILKNAAWAKQNMSAG